MAAVLVGCVQTEIPAEEETAREETYEITEVEELTEDLNDEELDTIATELENLDW